jgi:hypothetical protein
MIHQILANDRCWMAQPGVLVQRYEDLLADPAGGVLALAAHLGINLTATEAVHIADAYSLESNKARTEALRRSLERAGLNLDDDANAQICDSSTLLHWNHLRPSGAGAWTSQATAQQRVILHRLCRRWLAARNYALYPVDAQAGHVVIPSLGLRDRFENEVNLFVARINYLVRAASQRFPRLAGAFKQFLRIPTPAQVGATVWGESRASGAQSGGAIHPAGSTSSRAPVQHRSSPSNQGRISSTKT